MLLWQCKCYQVYFLPTLLMKPTALTLTSVQKLIMKAESFHNSQKYGTLHHRYIGKNKNEVFINVFCFKKQVGIQLIKFSNTDNIQKILSLQTLQFMTCLCITTLNTFHYVSVVIKFLQKKGRDCQCKVGDELWSGGIMEQPAILP